MKRKKFKSNYCIHGIHPAWCIKCKPANKHVSEPDLSAEQSAAKNLIKENKMVFLTGRAGTGKSHIVRSLKREYGELCSVTATTGLAAQLIKGGTIHGFMGWKYVSPGHPGHLHPYPAFNQRVKNCDLLVIDEVSMMSAGLLDLLFERFFMANHEPRVLLVGDLLQLGPVEENDENNYPYLSKHWNRFKVCKLQENHRQSEADFIEALNDIRIGKKSAAAIDLIRSRTFDKLPSDCTLLFARKRDAESVNERKLNELPGNKGISKWQVSAHTKSAKTTIPRSRFLENLYLKTGARVAFLNNDNEGRWVNGTTGTVSGLKEGRVTVDIDDGKTIEVNKAIDEVFDHSGNITHEVRQYPLMLSWALTIHKAQGMTLSRVGVSMDGHFAKGHTYTALSRCKTKNGLYLIGNFGDIVIDQMSLDICG